MDDKWASEEWATIKQIRIDPTTHTWCHSVEKQFNEMKCVFTNILQFSCPHLVIFFFTFWKYHVMAHYVHSSFFIRKNKCVHIHAVIINNNKSSFLFVFRWTVCYETKKCIIQFHPNIIHVTHFRNANDNLINYV